MTSRIGLLLPIILLLAPGIAAAQGKAPWEEYDKLISVQKAVTTLGPQLFGDSVDLVSGSLTFATTDVSIPGNSPLPVAVTRTFASVGRDYGGDGAFADWDIDIPNISGLFAPAWHDNRCDSAIPPGAYASGGSGVVLSVPGNFYWKGNTVTMPGGGELLRIDPSAARPSTGGPYSWITPGRTVFSCLPSIKNGTGQGFLAITADGTKYWFDHLARSSAASYQHSYPLANGTYSSATLNRYRNSLYATRVEDRFGNSVTYTYTNAPNQPVSVTSIAASDGRNISFHYNAYGVIDSATTASGTWTYQYTLYPTFGYFLTGVVQPDGGQWTIAFGDLAYAEIKYAATPDPNWRNCKARLGALAYGGPYTGTITHPSGAVGTFTVVPVVHGRSNVPLVCMNYTPTAPYNDTSDDSAVQPFKWHSITLTNKTITGPGLPTQAWSFSYTAGASWQFPAGESDVVCQTTTCLDPVCLSDACAGSATTTIIGPNGEWTRHTFGNSYRYNEGKLLKVEEGLDANTILRTTTKRYELAQSGKPYAVRIGTTQQAFGDGFTSEYPRPEVSNVISQQDVTFSRTVDTGCWSGSPTAYCLDAFLRPTQVKRFSSLSLAQGQTPLDTTTYYDQLASWVLGQVATQSTNGIQVARTDYDATTALPIRTYRFGLLQHTLAYNGDGTLAGVTDGRGNATALSSWYRGVPRLIRYPNLQTESATVNATGRLLTTTDELGSINSYGYDAMDRLSSIAYPTGDSVAWNGTALPFVSVAVAEYGIPAGHWKQTVQTGNGKSTTFYDAQWRPVLAMSEDTGNAASKSFVVNRYDAGGRLIFSSYPVASLTGINDVLQGSTTVYDVLGRVVQVRQDAEAPLNVLTTTTEYLPGFETRVTNPRGYKTITGYQVFEQPDTSRPVLIQAPGAVTTTITRDEFGKPRTVTRSGPGG